MAAVLPAATSAVSAVWASASAARSAAAGGVSVDPDPGKLPGGSQIQTLLDGLGGWALFASLAGLLISVMVWALGSFGGNYTAVARGKVGVVVCAACALLAGAAAPIINFFADLGAQVR
jgi:hypothetical protein